MIVDCISIMHKRKLNDLNCKSNFSLSCLPYACMPALMAVISGGTPREQWRIRLCMANQWLEIGSIYFFRPVVDAGPARKMLSVT